MYSNGLVMKNEIKRQTESLVIRELDLPTLKCIVMKNITFTKMNKKGEIYETEPSTGMLQMLLNRGYFPGIPIINGIAESPFIRSNGTVCYRNGYDYHSGYMLNSPYEFDQVPENPTEDDVKKSWDNLEYVFSDFPFANPRDISVPIAMMLSIMARTMFGNVPAFVFEASTAGSGKTLLIDACSVILFGRISAKQTWPEGRDSNVELEKILSAVSLDASPILVFDNLDKDSQVKGAALDKVLTSNGTVKFRVLGKSKSKEMGWNTVIAITGNNTVANIYGDTRRRVIPCRLEPQDEHPENRTDIKEKNLLEYVRQNRSKLIGSLLILVRYWYISGQKKHIKPIGSFEEWTDVIGGSLFECSGINIRECFEGIQEVEDEEYSGIVSLLEYLNDKFIMGMHTNDLDKACKEDYTLKDLFVEVINDDITPRRIGRLFARINGKVYSGFRIVKAKVTKRAITWNVVKAK